MSLTNFAPRIESKPDLHVHIVYASAKLIRLAKNLNRRHFSDDVYSRKPNLVYLARLLFGVEIFSVIVY